MPGTRKQRVSPRSLAGQSGDHPVEIGLARAPKMTTASTREPWADAPDDARSIPER
jgi:hypothetical protein